MYLNQDQKSMAVQTVESRFAALSRIEAAIERFRSIRGQAPSLVQVGSKLFHTAFPDTSFPHNVGAIGEVCIFPRPDLCGEWAIVIPKPQEFKQ